jgi:hypothetical protein
MDRPLHSRQVYQITTNAASINEARSLFGRRAFAQSMLARPRGRPPKISSRRASHYPSASFVKKSSLTTKGTKFLDHHTLRPSSTERQQ